MFRRRAAAVPCASRPVRAPSSPTSLRCSSVEHRPQARRPIAREPASGRRDGSAGSTRPGSARSDDRRHGEAGRVVAFELAFGGAVGRGSSPRFRSGDGRRRCRSSPRGAARAGASRSGRPRWPTAGDSRHRWTRLLVWGPARDLQFEELAQLPGTVAGNHEDWAELRASSLPAALGGLPSDRTS